MLQAWYRMAHSNNSGLQMLKPIHAALLCIFLAQPALCFESGFYSQTKTPAAWAKLWNFMNEADRTLRCKSFNEIDLGIESEDGQTIFFSPRQVKSFLRADKHKETVVVHLYPLAEETSADRFERFLTDLGYKRILITRGTALGTIVVKDRIAAESH